MSTKKCFMPHLEPTSILLTDLLSGGYKLLPITPEKNLNRMSSEVILT